MTHVDVPLYGQGQGQPVGGRVEYLRCGLQTELEHVASCPVPVQTVVTIKQVEIDVPGSWQEDGQEVTNGHGDEDCVGRGAHVVLTQHNDDNGVGHQSHHHQEWHYVSK